MALTYVLSDEYPRQALQMIVSGPDRHLYFKRPIIPLMQPQMPDVIMRFPQEQKVHQTAESQAPIQITRTVGVQTIYRQSEAQTDPFSPQYTTQPGQEPQVLAFTYFTYQNGLPASMAQMQLIQQARQKRLFEALLPASTDQASFALRRRLMDQQEFKEWAKRQSDIKRIQNQRLNLLQTALIDREKENEQRNAQRVQELKLKKTEQKDRALVKIGRKRIKVLRKMFKQRKAADRMTTKRDIIEQYADYGSGVYAGITRDGLNLDKLANKYEVQPQVLTAYEGLRELADTLPQSVLTTTLNVHSQRKRVQKSRNRKEMHHLAALAHAQRAIDQVTKIHDKGDDSKGQGKLSVAQVRSRPDTPVVEQPQNEDQQKRYIAAVVLQRLLRGRAIQNAMHKGKQKRLDLIAELRRTGQMMEMSELEQEKELLEAYRERVIDSMAEALQGDMISSTLDILSKELVRLKQERKISAIVKHAERERRKKECQEAGRRQAEEVLRAREDALFRSIMDTHQGSVDSYLQNIITRAVGEASATQAMDEAQLRAYQINKIVDTLEDRLNKPQTIIRDLVSSFLIPEVERTQVMRRIQMEEKRHLLAARLVLKETSERARKRKEF